MICCRQDESKIGARLIWPLRIAERAPTEPKGECKMTEKRLAFLMLSVALLAAILACHMPEAALPTPTASVPEPAEPTPTVSEASPIPEQTLAPSPTPERAQEAGPSPTPTPESILRVVYTSEGNLWISEGKQPARPLTAGVGDTSPMFSPDGRWVLFRRELPPGPAGPPRFELRAIGVDGSGERVLVRPEDLPGEMGTPADSDATLLLDRLPLQIGWLPDGRTVAFNTHIEEGYGLVTNDDLWLVDLESGAPTPLLGDGEGGTFVLSPDGLHLVVCTASTVSVLEAGGGNRRLLVSFDFVDTASEYAYQPVPAWAPDGSYALVAISSAEPFGPDPAGTIWRLPLSGDAVPLATLAGEFLFNTMSDELWSSDRTRIAYTVPVDDSRSMHSLVIAKADGSDPVVYATGELGFFGWAPEGGDFAFWQNHRSEVYVGALGRPPRRFLAPPGETGSIALIRWAGAGTLVYAVEEAGEFTILAGRIDGDQRLIGRTAGPYPQFDVHW